MNDKEPWERGANQRWLRKTVHIAWTFIPVVVATDLSTGAKSALTALLGATPFMTKIAAVAIMGKPAYDLFKRTVLKSLRVRASS